MRQLLIIGACVLGICVGVSAAFPYVRASQARQQSAAAYISPEVPALTTIWGTVISEDAGSSTALIEAISPYAPSERILLRVRLSDETSLFSAQTSGNAPAAADASENSARLSDLRPGTRVWITVKRQPGPLEATVIWIVS